MNGFGTGYRPGVADFLAEAAEVCAKDGVPKKSGHSMSQEFGSLVGRGLTERAGLASVSLGAAP